jgi:hypothetical protein
MRPSTAALSAALQGALVSSHVSRVCLSGIAMPIVNEIIGRSTRNSANNVLPSSTTRRCSRTHRRKRNVQLLPTNADENFILYVTSTRNYKSVPIYFFANADEDDDIMVWIWKIIMNAEDVIPHYVNLETLKIAHFVKQRNYAIMWTKQLK